MVTGGVIPRFVESSDGTIESGAGQLTLRSGGANVIGKPIVRLDEAPAGGTLTFGLQDAGGQPSKLLTVDPQGNLTIAGIFNGLFGGAVKVASGIATHGIVLPLPDGITEEQAADGGVTLHVQLTPHPPGRTPYDADIANFPIWIGTAISAAVDADRRLQCLVQWVGFRAGGGPLLTEVLSGACDYVVLAVVNGGGA